MTDASADVAIIGAGAAGLATAIFTRTHGPALTVRLFDGAPRPGAKILVSGGSRCNVTNVEVDESDFNGGSRVAIRRVLRAFTAADARAWFEGRGLALHEEPNGKLFPDSHRSRDVLDLLLDASRRAGVRHHFGERVSEISRSADGFVVRVRGQAYPARRVVLATGGLSLPKTGSDGWGYDAARALGHTVVATTPALVPLTIVDGGSPLHKQLTGVAQPTRLEVQTSGRVEARIDGAMLWTHFGISGPAALDVSRHWLRARLEERDASLVANLVPAHRFDTLEALLVDAARLRPRTHVDTVLAELLPASVGAAIIAHAGVPAARTMSELTRDERRRLIHALVALPLAITGSRGYNYAEVTAGGVSLSEIDPGTMTSRVCPGLSLVGEVLDVDGRIGGFNFQWAWSSAWVAARHLAAAE